MYIYIYHCILQNVYLMICIGNTYPYLVITLFSGIAKTTGMVIVINYNHGREMDTIELQHLFSVLFEITQEYFLYF